MIDNKRIISRHQTKRFEKPCVRNTRITVYNVPTWLASGQEYADILQDFPELTLQDIRACLAYAADKEQKL